MTRRYAYPHSPHPHTPAAPTLQTAETSRVCSSNACLGSASIHDLLDLGKSLLLADYILTGIESKPQVPDVKLLSCRDRV